MKEKNKHLNRWHNKLVKLAAYICQDGCANFKNNKFYINENLKIIIPLLNSLNIDYRREYKKAGGKAKKPYYRIAFSSKAFIKLLNNYKVKTKCTERYIPSFVFKKKRYLYIWLRAMIDCNGSITSYGRHKLPHLLRFFTSSKKEAEQLEAFGFCKYKSKQHNKAFYSCHLHSRIAFLNFYSVIGYLDTPEKNKRLQYFVYYEKENMYRPDLMLKARLLGA